MVVTVRLKMKTKTKKALLHLFSVHLLRARYTLSISFRSITEAINIQSENAQVDLVLEEGNAYKIQLVGTKYAFFTSINLVLTGQLSSVPFHFQETILV